MVTLVNGLPLLLLEVTGKVIENCFFQYRRQNPESHKTVVCMCVCVCVRCAYACACVRASVHACVRNPNIVTYVNFGDSKFGDGAVSNFPILCIVTSHTHTTVLRLCGICPGKPG